MKDHFWRTYLEWRDPETGEVKRGYEYTWPAEPDWERVAYGGGAAWRHWTTHPSIPPQWFVIEKAYR